MLAQKWDKIYSTSSVLDSQLPKTSLFRQSRQSLLREHQEQNM